VDDVDGTVDGTVDGATNVEDDEGGEVDIGAMIDLVSFLFGL